MALNWKDLITTILAGLVAYYSYLVVTGYNFPLLNGYRWATLVLLILGIGMCAFSSGAGVSGPFITIASGLGILAFVLIILSFIFATKTIFLAAAATILLLWLIATFRHLIGA